MVRWKSFIHWTHFTAFVNRGCENMIYASLSTWILYAWFSIELTLEGFFNVILSKFPTSTEDYHPHFTDEEWEVKGLPKGHTANMCWNTYLPTSLTYNKFLKILWIQAFSSSARNSLKCHSLSLFRVWPQSLALPAPQGFRKLQSLNLQAASCLSKGEGIMPAVACSRPGLIKVNLWWQRL